MKNKMLTVAEATLKTMLRQKSIIFSCFLLPVITIWSTWWITADIPMTFKLNNGVIINSNMIDVHIVTGGLTAIALTAGIFGFIITADGRKIADRLYLMGYPSLTINMGWLTALLSVLLLSAGATSLLTILLYEPISVVGLVISIVLTTILYAAFGYTLGILYPKIMEGTLIVLLFSFIDLMLLVNPMGENLYLSWWTKIMPGFIPTQLALESAFIGLPDGFIVQTVAVFMYAVFFIFLAQFSRYVERLGVLDQFKRGVKS